jgi:hypothetical protein
MLRPSRDESDEGSSDERSDNETDGFNEHEKKDVDDDKLMKLQQEWKRVATRMTTKLDKESMKAIAILALVVFILLRLTQSGAGPPQPLAGTKSLRRPALNTEDSGDPTDLNAKKQSKQGKKLVEDLDKEEGAEDPTADSVLSGLSNAAVQGLSYAGGLPQPGGGAFGTGQNNAWATPQQNFLMPGLMQQQGQVTQQAFLQAQQQQAMLQAQQQQQMLLQLQAQKQLEEQLLARQEAFKLQQQQQQQALLMQQQALMAQLLQPQLGQGTQPGMGQLLSEQGGVDQQSALAQFMQAQGALGQQLLQPGLGQMSTLQQEGALPGAANSLGAPDSLLQIGGLNEIGEPGALLPPNASSADAALASPLEDTLPLKTAERPSDADVAKAAEAIPLTELNHFRDSWSPFSSKDIPIYFHVPKAGGSTVKDVVGSCLRMVMASEFGVTDGHDKDTEIAIVYPKVPGGTGAEDRSPFVNVDTTSVAGIDRAAKMGFADSGLAGCVVTPFLYESNALFTETAQGRLFAVFRHPVDRAVSMFYYLQVADWGEF